MRRQTKIAHPHHHRGNLEFELTCGFSKTRFTGQAPCEGIIENRVRKVLKTAYVIHDGADIWVELAVSGFIRARCPN